MRGKLIILIVVTAAITFTLAACGGGGAGSLDGTDWILTSLHGQIPLGSFTLSFAEGEISGKAGCNSYFGGYDQSGDTLDFPMIAMTEMYCMDPEGIMDQESKYLGIMSRVNTFSRNETQLRLEATDGAFLVFEAVE
jgi:heat shock protein HslJ